MDFEISLLHFKTFYFNLLVKIYLFDAIAKKVDQLKWFYGKQNISEDFERHLCEGNLIEKYIVTKLLVT